MLPSKSSSSITSSDDGSVRRSTTLHSPVAGQSHTPIAATPLAPAQNVTSHTTESGFVRGLSGAATTGDANGPPSQYDSRSLQHNFSSYSSDAPGPSVDKRGSQDGSGTSPVSSESTSHPGPEKTGAASPPQDQRAKRRRAGPGSRGVANLTPEQLAKKRANDREAQRAIRERTKNQIESLENRIRELTSQQPYQELQKVIEQKEAVEAENAELKARMASILNLIQPCLGGTTAAPGYSPSLESRLHQQPSAFSVLDTPSPGTITSPTQSTGLSWPGDRSSQPRSYPQQGSHTHQMDQQNKETSQRQDYRAQGLSFGDDEPLSLNFLVDPSLRLHKMQTGVNGAQDSPEYRHLPMEHDWMAAIPTMLRNNSNPADFPAPPEQDIHGGQQQRRQQRVEYAHRPSHPPMPYHMGVDNFIKNCGFTCTLDSVLLDFLKERRQRAAQGLSPREVVGPKYPSVRSLLNEAQTVHAHPLSQVFTRILTTFPAICRLPEKVTVLYVMFMVMRLQISWTEENYMLTPPFARPLPCQFSTPHPAWIDHLPFPAMREKLVREYNARDYLFDDFFIPYTTTLSVNWPYSEREALLETPDDEVIINPVFLTHLCREENWTLGPAFHEAFPSLRGTYNLKDA
ncbi:BZIP transcription factor [Xylariaceae sp. FL0594]|nr:BZIP transcription factor [Xylariaceae sp. FL0594]